MVSDLKKRKERHANIEVKPFAFSEHFLIQTDEHFDAKGNHCPQVHRIFGSISSSVRELQYATASKNAAICTKTR